MNTGIIIKIEARLLTVDEFTEIDFTGFSGTISKETSQNDAGILHETEIGLKIPHIQPVITDLLDSLLFRKAQFRVLDGNGKTHLVGDNSYPARLSYVQGLDGNSGSWNGYTVTINHKSPQSYPLSES